MVQVQVCALDEMRGRESGGTGGWSVDEVGLVAVDRLVLGALRGFLEAPLAGLAGEDQEEAGQEAEGVAADPPGVGVEDGGAPLFGPFRTPP
ncbi:hypothetical protein [Streptomyces avermitilis]|uniref:hypothetical protein n=1 Tax=Streptomyces avermitilis TaxID=33903 RepID=UPI0033D9F117